MLTVCCWPPLPPRKESETVSDTPTPDDLACERALPLLETCEAAPGPCHAHLDAVLEAMREALARARGERPAE